VNITGWKSLAFVSSAVHCDDSAIPRKEPQHSSIELTHVSQFKEPAAERFRQGLAVIFPIPQLCKSREDRCEIIRIASVQRVLETPALDEFLIRSRRTLL
jgi:hypothetical protein